MKIFYAIQATGNGHISRAMEILPYLEKYGSVDLFLSGSNSHLPIDAQVKFKSNGVSLFYGGNGGLNYFDTVKSLQPKRIYNEAKNLPVEKYDLVLNDFDSITALACILKNVKSVNFGHQASFVSKNTPRPNKKEILGELVLKNYARATKYIGLHFEQYDDFILPPIIKKEIWNATPQNKGHITIYLNSYLDKSLIHYFSALKNFNFHLFSKEAKTVSQIGNIKIIPIEKVAFNDSLINCDGIITGAGFETPAEALYLKKKLMVLPINGQYEQKCNAAALEKLGVQVLKKIDKNFSTIFYNWIQNYKEVNLNYTQNTNLIINRMMEMAIAQCEVQMPNFEDNYFLMA